MKLWKLRHHLSLQREQDHVQGAPIEDKRLLKKGTPEER